MAISTEYMDLGNISAELFLKIMVIYTMFIVTKTLKVYINKNSQYFNRA